MSCCIIVLYSRIDKALNLQVVEKSVHKSTKFARKQVVAQGSQENRNRFIQVEGVDVVNQAVASLTTGQIR